VARIAVDIPGIVGDRIERDELFPRSRRSLAKIPVEHLLPRSGVDCRRPGQHATEIEQARSHAIG